MRDPSRSQCRPRCPALTSPTDRGHLTPLEELDTFRSAFFLSVFPDSVISLTQVFSQSVWTVVGLTPRAAQTIPYGTVTGQLIIGAMQDPKVSERSLQDDFKGKNSFCTKMVKKKGQKPTVLFSLCLWNVKSKGQPRALNRARTDSDLRSLVPIGSPLLNLSGDSPTRRGLFKRSEQQSNKSSWATYTDSNIHKFCDRPSANIPPTPSPPLGCVQWLELWAQAGCLNCCWRPPTGASSWRWEVTRAWIARRAWTQPVSAGQTGQAGIHFIWFVKSVCARVCVRVK